MTFTPSKEFQIIAAEVKSTSIKVPDATRLKLYGLYKQTTMGDTGEKEPWVTGIDSAKLKAWVLVKGTPRESSQAQYIAEAENVLRPPKTEPEPGSAS